ncbi:Vacuolar protein-sorting protein bro1 [Smittium mucronatum]|uniref:BRO domain-containing protein 1 n=1 Tax=Smittium mucronatum TaxID=133383 RepID=A0A1R0H5L9_9FUNG|nr:Vacuolar protein-sorting protein bro1 [Smittium mucronatum]
MEGYSQLPMIQISLKSTHPYHWIDVLPKFIKLYFQDPKNYSSEIESLDNLRSQISNPEFNLIGRDSIYKYFSQLNLFELRIPPKSIDDSKISFQNPFIWSDSFTKEDISSSFLDYEKSCVLFNLAVTLSRYSNNLLKFTQTEDDSSKKDLSTELSTACTNYQIASALFLQLSKENLDFDSIDMQPFSLDLLSNISLAQAQECVVSKAIYDEKKDSVIAKLCSQASAYYLSLSNSLDDYSRIDFNSVHIDTYEDVVSSLPSSWSAICNLKLKFYSSLADLYQAKFCQSKKKFGESVSRFLNSQQRIKASISKSHYFEPGLFDSDEHTIEGLSPLSYKTLKSNLSILSKQIDTLTSEAIADNDLIYHEPVPELSDLQSINPVSVVKPLKFIDALTEREHIDIVGNDIFESLIPINVHERASIYSEELSQLLRTEQEKFETSESELDTSLSFMKLSEIITKFETYLNNPSRFGAEELDRYSVPHKDLVSLVSNSQEYSLVIEDLISQLSKLTSKSEVNVENCSSALNKLSSSNNNNSEINSQLPDLSLKFKKCIDKQLVAKESDSSVLRQYRTKVLPYLEVLKSPETLQSFIKSFLEKHIKDSGIDISGSHDNSASLLDLDDDITGSNDGAFELKDLIGNLKSTAQEAALLKTRHQNEFEKLKLAIRDDDISSALMLNPLKNSADGSSDKILFQEEITKFDPILNHLSEFDLQKKSLVKFLVNSIKSINENPKIKLIYNFQVTLESGCELVEKNLNSSCETMSFILPKIRSGIKFYSELNSEVNKIFFKVENLANSLNQSFNARVPQLQNNDVAPPAYSRLDAPINDQTQIFDYSISQKSSNSTQPLDSITQSMNNVSISSDVPSQRFYNQQNFQESQFFPRNQHNAIHNPNININVPSDPSEKSYTGTQVHSVYKPEIKSNDVPNSNFDFSRLDERYKKAMEMVDASIPSINNSHTLPPSQTPYRDLQSNYYDPTRDAKNSFNSSPSSISDYSNVAKSVNSNQKPPISADNQGRIAPQVNSRIINQHTNPASNITYNNFGPSINPAPPTIPDYSKIDYLGNNSRKLPLVNENKNYDYSQKNNQSTNNHMAPNFNPTTGNVSYSHNPITHNKDTANSLYNQVPYQSPSFTPQPGSSHQIQNNQVDFNSMPQNHRSNIDYDNSCTQSNYAPVQQPFQPQPQPLQPNHLPQASSLDQWGSTNPTSKINESKDSFSHYVDPRISADPQNQFNNEKIAPRQVNDTLTGYSTAPIPQNYQNHTPSYLDDYRSGQFSNNQQAPNFNSENTTGYYYNQPNSKNNANRPYQNLGSLETGPGRVLNNSQDQHTPVHQNYTQPGGSQSMGYRSTPTKQTGNDYIPSNQFPIRSTNPLTNQVQYNNPRPDTRQFQNNQIPQPNPLGPNRPDQGYQYNNNNYGNLANPIQQPSHHPQGPVLNYTNQFNTNTTQGVPYGAVQQQSFYQNQHFYPSSNNTNQQNASSEYQRNKNKTLMD